MCNWLSFLHDGDLHHALYMTLYIFIASHNCIECRRALSGFRQIMIGYYERTRNEPFCGLWGKCECVVADPVRQLVLL